jgi:hypothetical protein
MHAAAELDVGQTIEEAKSFVSLGEMSEASFHHDLGESLEGHALLLWMAKSSLWLRKS